MTSDVVVFDLEANGLLDKATTVHCGVVSNLNGDDVEEFRPWEIKSGLLKRLREADVLIGHNIIAYDLPLLEKLHGFKYEGKVVDTLVMSRLHNPDRRLPINAKNKRAGPHSLYAWGVRVGRDKPDYDAWEEYDEEMLHRCSEDVEINKLTFFELMKEVKGQDWRKAHLLSFELFKNLHRQEMYGWLVDQEYMQRSINLLTHWMERIDRIITPLLPLKLIVDETKVKGEYKYVSKPFKKNREYTAQVLSWMDANDIHPSTRPVAGAFSRVSYRITNINSNEETKDYLLSQGWVPEVWNYKKDEKGRPAKDKAGNLIRTSPKLSGDDPFVGINGGIGRLIARRVQVRHRRSQIEGWVKNIRDDGRLSSGVSGIATTGRMKHKTLVNVPGGDSFFGKQMRKCFTSKPGYVIVGCDSDACQSRMLAARVGDPEYTKALLEGTKEDKTSVHFVNQRALREVAGIDATYHQSKTLNYAHLFGASDTKLASTFNSTSKELGAKIREALLSVAAGFERLVSGLTEEWRSHAKKRLSDWGKMEHYKGWVIGLDGRPIYISSEHQILVYVLQSDEAIMMSAAYNLLWKRLSKKYKYGEDFGVVCMMHDEYNIECKEEIAEDVARIAEKCIEDAGRFYKINVPHVGEAKIGETWWDVH